MEKQIKKSKQGETKTITRQFQITIINEDENERKEQYRFIRNSQYAQYKGLNKCMGYLMAGYYANGMDVGSQGFKDHQKTITNSLYIFDDIEFGKGLDSKSSITKKVKSDFSTALKNGLARGERSVTNYKRDFPLMTRSRALKFYEEDEEVFVNWVNKIKLKVVLPSKKDKGYVGVQHFLRMIITGQTEIAQSSVYFNKDNKLMLILSYKHKIEPYKETIKGRVLGVDLGIKIPAYVALNDREYIHKGIGCIDDLLKVRKQFEHRHDRMKKRVVLTNGGHGRKDKLKALESFKEKEKNYVKNYNHLVSKEIIKFAKKHQVEQINVELLALADSEKEIIASTLRYWSYYQLQEMIKYKAELEGIAIKYVDPYRTSQTCSICGHWEEGQRNTQAEFKCKNKDCGHEENADRNAARNIAKSKKYITKKEESQFFKNKEEIN